MLLVLTEWEEFRWLDFDKVGDAMAARRVVDARNLLDRDAIAPQGLRSTRGSAAAEAAGHRSMARVVVTGGAGFLGSHLCDALLDRGDEVVCIDNLATGRVANIEHLFGRSGFTFVRHDVTQYVWVPGDVDAVMHLASPASPKDYLDLPIQTLKVGSLGTHTTLGLAKAKGARYFLASTSEVYGDPAGPSPARVVLGPRQPDRTPRRLRRGQALRRGHGDGLPPLPRHGGAHRPHLQHLRTPDAAQRTGGSCRTSWCRPSPGKPLTVYGDGSQTRSFCYVDDTVRGFLVLLDSDMNTPVNIGNPEKFTILELAELVLEVTGSDSEIVFEPLPVDDPTQRRPDITLAREHLGWEPRVPIREALEATARVLPGSATAVIRTLLTSGSTTSTADGRGLRRTPVACPNATPHAPCDGPHPTGG